MNIVIGLVTVVVFFIVLIYGIDFTHFVIAKRKQTKATKGGPAGYACHAGGTIFVQGKKTYYTMPNGVRRVIADYPMDLNPSSPDMQEFLKTMEQARIEHNAAEKAKRMKAKKAMVEVAREVAE